MRKKKKEGKKGKEKEGNLTWPATAISLLSYPCTGFVFSLSFFFFFFFSYMHI